MMAKLRLSSSSNQRRTSALLSSVDMTNLQGREAAEFMGFLGSVADVFAISIACVGNCRLHPTRENCPRDRPVIAHPGRSGLFERGSMAGRKPPTNDRTSAGQA